jgi:lipopolysaccharide biosynthesis protein
MEDYLQIASVKMNEPPPEYIRYRGVMPSWDNTPRRGKRAHILVNASPAAYEEWLRVLVLQARENALVQEPLVFINAWNEWAEGTHLEPDEKYGHAYLEATRRALST